MGKILIVSKYYYPFNGGIEENVRYVAEYSAIFHDVTVVSSNHENGNAEDRINGVTVKRRNVHLHLKGQPISLGLLSGIRLGDYDLVHFHSPNPFATALFLARRLFCRRTPVVVTHHMDIFGRRLLRHLSLPPIRHLIRGAAATIVTSQKNIAVSRDLPKDANYKVVPLAVSPENYVIDETLRRDASAWRTLLAGEAPVVGFIGRHARYKGLPVMMEALAKLPGVHALVGGDGPYRQEAENKAKELGIADRVHFLGRLHHRDKLKLLVALDVFVFPSTEITEAFGISQMEAMLCGVPVVASDLPTGVTDVSIDGHTALLAPPGDSDGLAGQVQRLIEDRALAERLAETGRRHVLTNMTYDSVSQRTLAIFEAAMLAEPDGTGEKSR